MDKIVIPTSFTCRIISTNLSRGYLVEPLDSPPSLRGWLPAYCLHPTSQGGRRGLASWGFRVRKSSFTRGRAANTATPEEGDFALREGQQPCTLGAQKQCCGSKYIEFESGS